MLCIMGFGPCEEDDNDEILWAVHEPSMKQELVEVALPAGWIRFEDSLAILIIESLYKFLGYEIDLFRHFNVRTDLDMLHLADSYGETGISIHTVISSVSGNELPEIVNF